MTAALPPQPQNARVVGPDGQEYPIDLTYAGQVDGIHVWRQIGPPILLVSGAATIRVGILPARTTIQCNVRQA